MASEFGTGKTIFVLAIVVGCFAVLWPKVFYPMLTASTVKPPAPGRPGSSLWKLASNKEHLGKLCYILEEHHLHAAPFDATGGDVPHRWASEADCFDVIKVSCGVVVTEAVLEGFRLGAAGNNLTECLTVVYGLSPSVVAAAAPPLVRPKLYSAQATGGARPERPGHLHPDMLHPALREKGRALPQRTIDKQARPGPMPGVRPPMGGGAGHISPSHQTKGTGSMSVIMPLYTVGIIIFFMYTIMKVLFKKGPEDDDKTPKLKDFHLDPEYRKYVFAEEYLDSGDAGQAREPYRRADQREASGLRRRVQPEQADTKIEDEQMDQLRRRLEDTERAMERLMSQMGSVSDKLTAAKITEVLSQAQAQAKLLKLQEDFTSDEDDFTTSEALTATISDDESLFSTALRHRLLQQILLEKHPDFQSQLDQPIEKGIYRYDDSSNKHKCFLQTRDQAVAATRNSPKAAIVRRLSSEPETRKAPSSTPSTGTNDKDSTPKAESQEPCIPKASSEVKSQGSASPNLNVDQKNTAMASTSFPSSMPAQKVSFRLPDSYVETPPNVSDLEDQSSDATETGADVSELRSFAEESAENQAYANDGYENDGIQKVVQEIVPELVMPSYKNILEEEQDNAPEFIPKYDDIPGVVQDNVPELAMPTYEDIPEEEQHNVPESVTPCYKDIPEVARDEVPELVMPKHEDIPEVEGDKVSESVKPSYKDIQEAVQKNIPALVMPHCEDNTEAMHDGIPESGIPRPEAGQESVHQLIMPSHNDIPEVTMPVGDTYAEPQIELPTSEKPEINMSRPEINVPSGECTSKLKMTVYDSDSFSDSNIKPALKMSTFDDKSDLKAQDGPSVLQIQNETTPAVKNTPSDSTPVFEIPVDEKFMYENVRVIDATDEPFSSNANIVHPVLPSDDSNSCIPGFKREDLESAQDLALMAQTSTSIGKQTDVTSNHSGIDMKIRTTDVDDNKPIDILHFAPTEKAEPEKAIADRKDILVTNEPGFEIEIVEIVRWQQSEVNQLAEGFRSKSSVSDGTVQASNIDVDLKLRSDNSNFSCDPVISMSDPTKSVQDDSLKNSTLMDDQMFSNNLVNNKLYEAMNFSNQVGEVNGNSFDSRRILKQEKEPHQTLIQLKLEKVDNDLFGKTSPQNLRDVDSDSSDADQVAVGTQTSLAFDPPRMLKKKAAEISTQTEEDRALSVMGLNTSWCVDQHGTQSGPIVSTPKIRDITLDVMLPSETQALVTQARMGSYSSKDLEDDVSESGTPPCVITSQISLNIIGLEQNEDTPHSKSSLVFQSAAPTQSVCYGLPSTSGRNTNNPNVEPVELAQSGAISKKTSTTDLPFNTISVYRHQDITFPRPSPSETSSANVQEEMSSPLSREWHAAERDFMSSYPNSGIVLTNKTFPSDHSENYEENRPRSPIPPSADESRYSSSNISSGFFTDKQFGGPQFFSDTPDSLMEYSGWSTDATKPSTSEFMTRSSTNFSDYPDEYFYEFPDYNSSTVMSNDVDTSFVGSMSSLDDDLMEPMYFACSVSYTPSSSIPQTPDQETEIKLACDPELSALADAAIEDDTTLYLPTGSPPTTPTEDMRPLSPQLNEASSLSSKRSSPDMEEYEVIQKDPAKSSIAGQAVSAAAPAPQV